MLIHIDARSGVPYFRQVMEQVTRMILSGSLAPGDKLDSVAVLAKRLKVNPMTISKAYSFMVEEHILERRPGIGVFVAELPDTQQRHMTRDLLARTLQKAATLAVQLGMSAAEASALLDEAFQKLDAQQQEGDHGTHP